MNYKIIERNQKFYVTAGGVVESKNDLYVEGTVKAFIKKCAYPDLKSAQQVVISLFRARPTIEKLAQSDKWDELKSAPSSARDPRKSVHVCEHWRSPPNTLKDFLNIKS